MYGDQVGRMWLGFENGEVAVFEGGAFRLYSTRDRLPAGVVLVITADTKGHIWVGGGGGLSRFESSHFSTITKQGGLPGDSVSGFVEDEDGSFWIAGAHAIFKVSGEQLEKALASPSYRMRGESFDGRDGLRGLPRQREPFPTATRAVDGWLWFATTEGIAAINPHEIPKNLVPPPVVIETVRTDDQALAASSGLQFHPNTRNLEFHFTALSFTNPAQVQFRYKLDGYDDGWRGPVSIRAVRYTNLPPASYTFRVLACNNSGVWNEVGASLTFTILPAFYQTAWFRLFYVAAGGMLFWLVYRLRLRQMTARVRLRYTERLAERTRIARELHDTLLQNLAGVTLQLDGIVKQVVSHPEKAVPLIGQVREQVDASFQQARVQVWNLRSTSLEGPGLAVTLQQFCERIGPSNTTRCEFQLVGQPRPLPAEFEEELLRIAQEATQNAVRHAHSNQIRVVLEYTVKWLQLSICDDGQGFDLQEGLRKADHWGLKSMHERAAQIHATCEITSSAGNGTRVQVNVPLPLKRWRFAIT
jgi:signal transduction histidine kinase